MTPAEFDTKRRELGLSVDETASLIGVTDRQVRRWAKGDAPVAANAIAALNALEDAMMGAIEQTVAHATDMMMTGPVVLWRYKTADEQANSPHAASLPLGAHAMLIAWTRDALVAEGIDTTIEWAQRSLG